MSFLAKPSLDGKCCPRLAFADCTAMTLYADNCYLMPYFFSELRVLCSRHYSTTFSHLSELIVLCVSYVRWFLVAILILVNHTVWGRQKIQSHLSAMSWSVPIVYSKFLELTAAAFLRVQLIETALKWSPGSARCARYKLVNFLAVMHTCLSYLPFNKDCQSSVMWPRGL